MEKLFMQMYSLRNESSFSDVLQNLAGMGYSGIELAGYNGMSSREMQTVLQTVGMEVVGNHISFHRLKNHLEEEMGFNFTIGNRNLVCPMCKFSTIQEIEVAANDFIEIGETCRRNGFQLTYHNHDHEFQELDGKYLLDILLELVPEELLGLELDVFWLQYAKVDPLGYLMRHKSRCTSIHVKDLRNQSDTRNVNLGEGIIDFTTIFNQMLPVQYIYEREDDGLYPWMQIEAAIAYFSEKKAVGA